MKAYKQGWSCKYGKSFKREELNNFMNKFWWSEILLLSWLVWDTNIDDVKVPKPSNRLWFYSRGEIDHDVTWCYYSWDVILHLSYCCFHIYLKNKIILFFSLLNFPTLNYQKKHSSNLFFFIHKNPLNLFLIAHNIFLIVYFTIFSSATKTS